MRTVLFFLGFCGLLFVGCNKNRKTFTLKSVKVNSYNAAKHFSQNIFVKITENDEIVLAITASYPADLTLPATFAVNPHLELKLYKNNYTVQLWGDSTGFISRSQINMDEYKIIFPIDMETKSDDVSFNVAGSWK